MTKIVQFATYGPPEVLEVAEIDPAPVQPGQVRIQVKAAGVQPFDCATRRGDFQQWQPVDLPARLGNEVAGVISEAGRDVTDLAEGDKVIAYLDMQGYATDVVVPTDNVAIKPSQMSWAQAGGLSVSGQTAYTALDALNVKEGDRLLIHAAAGGVGSAAVQLALIRGAQVIGTASERNHEYLRQLGATPVAHGPGLAERVRQACPQGVTAALDAIGGEALDVSMELLGSSARIVTIADWEKSAQLGIRRVGTDRSQAKLTELTTWFKQGRLNVEIAGQHPLEDAAHAHRQVETGHVRGKVVLTP